MMRLLALVAFGVAAGSMTGGFLETVRSGLAGTPSWEPAMLAGLAALAVYAMRGVLAD